MILRQFLILSLANSKLTNEELHEKNMRLQQKLTIRYDRAIRKAIKLERKLAKQKRERSVFPTMAHQVDFSLNMGGSNKKKNKDRIDFFSQNTLPLIFDFFNMKVPFNLRFTLFL